MRKVDSGVGKQVARLAPGINDVVASLFYGGSHMSRNLLLQSLLGHLALLAEKYPKKAASPVARRVKRYAKINLAPQQTKALRRAA